MAKLKKWEEVAGILRHRIITGQLAPGQDFPTTTDLLKEFDVAINTIQEAIKALIREGLVITFGSGGRRIVRPVYQRSIRRGGFLTEFGDNARIEILELNIIRKSKGLPREVLDEMKPPLLIYRTRQLRNKMPVALSCSYIPGSLPVEEIKKLIENPAIDLYHAMKTVGLKPYSCEESLIAAPATPEEEQNLYGAAIVQRIKRKVFDPEGNLLEMCYLTDRADCYEFVYRFKLEEESTSTLSAQLPGGRDGSARNQPILVAAGAGEHIQDLTLLDSLDEKKNDIEYLCLLLESNIIILTNKGRPLTPEQKSGFIKYLKDKTPLEFSNNDINFNDSPLAAHLEGEPDLKPELVNLMNISLKLNQVLERYLGKTNDIDNNPNKKTGSRLPHKR